MSKYFIRMPGLPGPLLQLALLGGGLVLSAGSSGTAKNKGNTVTITSPLCSAERPPSLKQSKDHYAFSCRYNGGELKSSFARRKSGTCPSGTFRHVLSMTCDGAEFDLRMLPRKQASIAKLPTTAAEKAAMAKEMLKAHNAYRAEIKLSPLTWSDRLAMYAAQWAEHLAKFGGTRPISSDSKKTGQGEHIWIGPANAADWKNIVQEWLRRNRQDAATQLGCAIAIAKDNIITVCRYWPPR